jgi:DNA-binding PadR family transcriptional regulator
MLRDVLLGLLRDGRARHGYELTLAHGRATGTPISPGSVYRELAVLARSGCIERLPAGQRRAKRRIPYVITERGRRTFDRWLRRPRDGEQLARVPFLGFLAVPERERFLEAWGVMLAARCFEAANAARNSASHGSDFPVGTPLLEHRLRLLRAENDLIEDVRRAFEHATDAPTAAKVRLLAVG